MDEQKTEMSETKKAKCTVPKCKRLAGRIRDVIRSPGVTMSMGLILIVFGLLETTDTALERLLHIDIGTGHGFILVGIVQVLHSIVIMIEGIENVSIAAEEQVLEAEIETEEEALK